MSTVMKQRRGTTAEWNAANPVLADGELGFEKDTKLFKVGDNSTHWAQLQYSPPGSTPLTLSKPPINAVTEGGFAGNGTFADTEVFLNLQNIAYNTGRAIYVPPGIYYLQHPINIIASTRIFGEGHGTSTHGTEFRPSQDFNLGYNTDPNTGLIFTPPIKPALFQCQIAPDPTGQNRWNYNAGLVWHDAHLKGLVLRNTWDGDLSHNIQGMDGLAIYYPGENSCLEDLWIEGFDTSYRITGNCGPFTSVLCSSWFASNFAFRFERHAQLGGNYGVARVFAPSGDNNTGGFFRVAGGYSIIADGLKMEGPVSTNDSVVVYDLDPIYVGTGTTSYGSFELRGAGCDLTGGIHQAGFITNLIHIKHTGTVTPSEFPQPSIAIRNGYFYGITNILADDGNGVVIPSSQTGTGDPRTELVYCHTPYEVSNHYVGGGYNFYGGKAVFYAPPKVPSYTVANLPSASLNPLGIAYAANGLKAGETTGNGTGVAVISDSVNWRRFDGVIVSA